MNTKNHDTLYIPTYVFAEFGYDQEPLLSEKGKRNR